ncbi:hypothetical protein [Methanosarcina barkeri]|uniref:hypothetical protein n=1 Tax=Methanosarcina barkeri TaxID=2208 RepID=UPI00003C682F|nr:hypothetical protein [Methanosarcina barkeri]
MRNTTPKSGSSSIVSTSDANNQAKTFLQFKERTATCCPFCGSTNIYKRSRSKTYMCRRCSVTFKDPVTRSVSTRARNNGKLPSFIMPKGAKA